MSVIHTAMSGIVVGGTRLRRDSGFADIATVLPEADIGQFSRCSMAPSIALKKFGFDG
jgi:hypothetical protein